METPYFSNSESSLSGSDPGERLEPLGAPNDDNEDQDSEPQNEITPREKLKQLEEEQEYLNSALFALTTHFAQVQLRLRQISNTHPDERGPLLNSLEEFASRGLPDLQKFRENCNDFNLLEGVKRIRAIQRAQLKKLKHILQDLETQIEYILKQDLDDKIVEIKSQLNHEYDRYIKAKTDNEEICEQHEVLVNQLKKQINDLEGFVKYLQEHPNVNKCVCSRITYNLDNTEKKPVSFARLTKELFLLMHFFTVFQIRCSTIIFRPLRIQTSIKDKHWGEIRAKVELSVHKVLEVVAYYKKRHKKILSGSKILEVIRNDLAVHLKGLIEHGSRKINDYFFLWGVCLGRKLRLGGVKGTLHAWEIIFRYYELNSEVLRMGNASHSLAESYDLAMDERVDVYDFLRAIEKINSSHERFKRDDDVKFQAFVCACLNNHCLVSWLRLVFENERIVRQNYYKWSYAASTKFKDCLSSLDSLTNLPFSLPVNFAIYSLEHIEDAFV